MPERRTLLAAAVAGVIGVTLAPARRAAAPPEDPSLWVTADPGADEPGDRAALDLRPLNERVAGEGGFIGARDGAFVQRGTGRPIRFWGVNASPAALSGEAGRRTARMLARRGVNLVRLHAPCFDAEGRPDGGQVARTLEAVETLKAEGIYAALSIYYPMWLAPPPGADWLPGYDGTTKAFAALMFVPSFQARYRTWWRALLLTPSPVTGRRLVDEPALAAIELQNEDSLLYPTLDALPDAPRRLLEGRFAAWLRARHGSVPAAFDRWGEAPSGGDALADSRVAVRPLRRIVAERTRRDADTVRFLVDTEVAFYREAAADLRRLGFRGVVGTSNWITADESLLGPLERMIAAWEGDFVDRHAYLDAAREGDRAAWSLRPGQTYADRSALRAAGDSREVALPLADVRWDGKPTMVSEVSWERPSRHRAEAPVTLAAYAALQSTGAVIHFQVERDRWASRHRGTAIPWPLTSPGQLGQFPAAALIYRLGLVSAGPVVARATLGREDLLALRAPGPALDPLLHLAGRVELVFGDRAVPAAPAARSPGPDRVRSATGELELDREAGLLVLDAPRAQGAVGALSARGTVATSALRISSPLETGAIVAVALDGKPVARSDRVLLQVMSEEQATGFASEPIGGGRRRLLEPGDDPWRLRPIRGAVSFVRDDAPALRVTALDLRGRPVHTTRGAARIELAPDVLHYLVER